ETKISPPAVLVSCSCASFCRRVPGAVADHDLQVELARRLYVADARHRGGVDGAWLCRRSQCARAAEHRVVPRRLGTSTTSDPVATGDRQSSCRWFDSAPGTKQLLGSSTPCAAPTTNRVPIDSPDQEEPGILKQIAALEKKRA